MGTKVASKIRMGKPNAKISQGNQRRIIVSKWVQKWPQKYGWGNSCQDQSSNKKNRKKYGKYGDGEIHAKISQGEPCWLFWTATSCCWFFSDKYKKQKINITSEVQILNPNLFQRGAVVARTTARRTRCGMERTSNKYYV